MVDTNQILESPTGCRGGKPTYRVTDFSQGREVTPEWGVKRGVGTRLSNIIAGSNPAPA
jgi:hypothetical protein